MVQKIIKCGFIGGLILFIWGAVSWTILPWQKNQLKTFTNQREVRRVIEENTTQSGLYILPDLHQMGSPHEGEPTEGLHLFAAVTTQGKLLGGAGGVIQTLILKMVVTCLVAWALVHTKCSTYHGIVKFVTIIGIAIGLSSTLPYVICFGFPGTFAISGIIESVIGWFFAALGMAKISHTEK